MPFYLIAILLYFAALTGLAFWRTARVRTADDFLIASRSLPAGVLVLTLLSTWIGSGSLFGGAGLSYRAGFAALWQSSGAWVGIALVYFIAPRARRIAQHTVPDILEMRYGSTARILGTTTIVLAYTAIAAYQFRGGGRLLSLVTGMDPATGALIVAAFCIACTALAGMQSVAYLDVVNGLTMVGGVGVTVVYLIGHQGGFGRALASVRPDQLTIFGSLSPLSAVALFLPTLFLLLGEATMYQKFFSAKDERAARLAVAGWMVGTVALEVLMVSVGLLGSVVRPGLGTAESETIVVRLALDVLPAVFGVLLVVAAAAIMVSTACSFLLTSATNVVHDVFQRFTKSPVMEPRLVVYARVVVAILGLAGVVAGNYFPTVLAIALWAYTMYGAGITPALVAAFVWPGATRRGAVSSIATGMLTTLIWEVVAIGRGSYPLGVQTVYPALLLSIGALIIVSVAEERRRADPATANVH